MVDILIVGSGPAGLSAAITARMRGKSVLVIGNSSADSGLAKAQEIGNYPGLPGISGAELHGQMLAHALGMGIEHITARITTILPMGQEISVSYGSDIASGKTLLLCTGVVQAAVFPGERELIGRGVSYCATCDGMLYRGKAVCVACLAPDAEEEADFLESIGCQVTRLKTKNITVNGTEQVTSVTADGVDIPCEGIFILRQTIAPSALVPGLETEKNHIKVDRAMKTNIPGIFAAGDATGTPYQVAKATGEGVIAALSAVDYLAHMSKSH